jgi:transcription elongation factor GreB
VAPDKVGEMTTRARSNYITAQGYAALAQEANTLWGRRREVVKHLSAAAAEGDRSENAEYIYRKKQLRELDRRIRYLQKRLPELEVVRRGEQTLQKVYFGADVTLEDEAGETARYRIVGSDEFDSARAWISVDSPVARALLGKSLDDEVNVAAPAGERTYWVTDIQYANED